VKGLALRRLNARKAENNLATLCQPFHGENLIDDSTASYHLLIRQQAYLRLTIVVLPRLSINNPKTTIKLVLILVALALYDTLWDLFLSLLHFVLGTLHILFEFCEHTLERLIEHLFHTDPRAAEIIVFYIMLTIGAYVAFKLMQALPHWYGKLAEQLADYWHQEKTKTVSTWQNQSVSKKIQWGSVVITSALVIVMWLIS
jgi:hypothetical protein